MSDSDNDLLTNSVFTFQNGNTTVCAKGPNINSTNITGFSFRNNILTSTMNMPRNFERQRYAESNCDQRSIYYRRETSPMSMYSGSDMRRQNIQNSYYARGRSSQRSVFNGRSGSPMSMRSIDSTASVSATDIAQAFKSMNFNKYDLRIIKDAYNKFMKTRIRKRIEKRRNMRLFLKGVRHRSGDDSGEQGSDSSISSDDCRSIRTTTFKENMSSCRSTKTDISDFRRTLTEKNILKDYTEQQNTLRNRFSAQPVNLNQHRLQNSTVLTQRDRFRNSFLLPSQRFNRTVATSSIPEKCDSLKNNNNTINKRQDLNMKTKPANMDNNMDSEQEEIFSEITVRENNHEVNTLHKPQLKRNRDIDDEFCNVDSKRTKLSSPRKNNNVEKTKPKNVCNTKERIDFEFVKPQFPMRKSTNQKPHEKLISRSKPSVNLDEPAKNLPESNIQPLTTVTNTMSNPSNCAIEINEPVPEKEQADIPHSTSDLSMRPSFIKRKLFTQRLEVTENKNTSLDSLSANSPKTVYSAIQKEKNKARKLVTNQSCLNRDVQQEDNNLLDLIHKIVPPEHINVTNATNKVSNVSNKNSIDAEDKWDITSIISTCKNDDGSDTYTDEEIFKSVNTNVKNVQKETKPKKSPCQNQNTQKRQTTECKIVVERLPKDVFMPCKTNNVIVKPAAKKNINNYVKSFWDTDFESDIEGSGPSEQLKVVKHSQPQQVRVDPKEIINKGTSNNEDIDQIKNNVEAKKSPVTINRYSSSSTVVRPKLNETVQKVQSLHNVSLSIRTHRVSKAKVAVPSKPVNKEIEKSKLDIKATYKTNETSSPKSIQTGTVLKKKATKTIENRDDKPKPKTKRGPKPKQNVSVELNQSMTDDSLNKTLRTRTIDLSMNKTNNTNKKKPLAKKVVPVKKVSPVKKITVTKKTTPSKNVTKITPIKKVVTKKVTVNKVTPVKKTVELRTRHQKDLSCCLTPDLSKSNLSFTLRPRRRTPKDKKIN